MGLSDEIKTFQESSRRAQCRVCRLFEEGSALPPEDQKDLEEALRNPDVQGSVLSRVLDAREIKVDQASIQRHRRLHL